MEIKNITEDTDDVDASWCALECDKSHKNEAPLRAVNAV